MYGSKWPFLLMYGSHNMRHTGFPRVEGLSTDPRDLGRHNHSRPHTIQFINKALKQGLNQVGENPYLPELSKLHKTSAHV